MDRPERRVAVTHGVDKDADTYQVIDLIEADVPGDHLLVHRVVVLGPPGDPRRLDLGLAQVGGHLLDDLLQEQVAPGGPLGDHPRDLVVPLGVQRGERQVLQLPLDGVHAEPVRERGEDLQRLACLPLLLLPRQVAQRAHVVQAVGELDHQHPDVAGHRDHHLAHGFRLGGLAVLDPVQLGNPVDQRRHVVTEAAAQLVQRVGGVFQGVMQQRGADGLGVHAEFGQDRGHRERMGDVGVAALALLVGVPLGGHLVGAVDEPDVRFGMSSANRLDQRLKHRVHPSSAGCAEAGQPAADPRSSCADAGGRPGGGGLCGGGGRRGLCGRKRALRRRLPRRPCGTQHGAARPRRASPRRPPQGRQEVLPALRWPEDPPARGRTG